MDDKDQVKFISSLDFDITKVNPTLEQLGGIFDKNMSALEKKVRDSTENISKMITGIGGISLNIGGGVGSPQQAAKEINKNLANVMTNAIKHLNSFLDKVGDEVHRKETEFEFGKDLDNMDKEIAKFVHHRINLKTADIREELHRVPVWARSNKGSKLDDIADETLGKFPGLEGRGGNTPSEMLLNWFDHYKAYNKTKKDLLYEINEITQGLAKVRDYAGRNINEITGEVEKALGAILDPKELDKFKELSFEGKRDYLVDTLQKYRLAIDGFTDESTNKIKQHIDTILGEVKTTTTKADIVKQAVNNLNTAQEDLQKKVVNIIDNDIKSITETFKQSELSKLSITNYFDPDGNIKTTKETYTDDRAKAQVAAYKDLENLQKQLFKIENERIGASEKQLKILDNIENVIEEQMADVYKIIEAHGLENEELQAGLMTEHKKLGNAVMLKKAKKEETDEAKKQALVEKQQAEWGKAEADARKKAAREELQTSKERNKLLKEQWDLRKRMEDKLPGMEAAAAVAQQTIRTKELSVELSSQAATIREQIRLMRDKLTQSGSLTKEEAKQTAELESQLNLLQQQVKIESGDLAQGKTIREAPFMARMQTALSYGMIYKGIQAMKQAVSTISGVEMGITEIARVSDDASFNFGRVRDRIVQLGIDYGQTFENVQHITLRWVQSGYDIADSLELTKTSLLALNTAELDAREATESLIGIMAQWGLQTSELSSVLDKINKTADSFTVTSQDLVDGLLRSSGAARIMGLSIEQTIALLTTMREASGRTGREVGNALNSILSYIQRAKSIDIMETMGIRMFADEAKTEFRNVFEIFSELAAKWSDPNIAQGAKDALMAGAKEAGLFAEELAEVVGLQEEHAEMLELEAKATEQYTDVQKRDAAQAAAGIFRRNYFIGLLEKFATTQKVLTTMNEAEGYSMKENVRTMETLEKKVQSLKTASTQLAIAIGEAGLLDVLKDAADTTKDWVSAIAKIDNPLKDLIINLGIVLGTIKAVKVTAHTMGFDMILGRLGGLLMKPVPAAVSAALIGIGAIIMTWKTHLKEAAEEKERLLEGSAEEVTEIERLDFLINKYGELAEASNEDIQAKKELLDLQRQLAEEFPEYADGLNDENELVVTNIDAIKELNDLKRQELDLKRQELAIKLKEKDIPNLEKRQIEIKERLAAIDKQIADGDTKRIIRHGRNAKIEIDYSEKLRKEKQELLLEQQKNNIEIQKAEVFLKEYGLSALEVYTNMLRKSDELKNKSKTDFIEMYEDSEDFYSKVLTGYQKLYGDIKGLYDLDLSHYTSLGQAKADIELKLIAGIGDRWSEYYDAQHGVLKMEMAELQRLGQIDPKAKADFELITNSIRTLNRLKTAAINVAPGGGGTGGYGSGTDEAGAGSGSGISGSEALEKVGRYFELEQAIDKINLKLAENKALQENENDIAKLNALREREVELYKQMQDALHQLNIERRTERDELREDLQQYFDFDGDYIMNFKEVMDKKLAEVNKHASDKDKTTFNKMKEEYKAIETSAKRYFDLVLKELPNASEQWWKYAKNVEKVNADITKSIEDAQNELRSMVRELIQIEKDIDERKLKEKEKQHDSDVADLEKSIYIMSEKEFDKLQQGKIKALENEIKLTEKKLKNKKDDIVLQETLNALEQELYYEQEKSYDTLVNYKEVYEELANNRIATLEAELEALEEKDELEKEIEERERRQLEIKQLQLKLDNVRKQKTVQELVQKADGTWEFAYVADQKQVESLQDELKNKIESFDSWEKDNNLKHKRNSLQEQIKHERDILQTKQDSYNKMKKSLDEMLESERKALKESYDDMDVIVEKRMDKLIEESGNKWDVLIEIIKSKLVEAQEIYRELLGLQAAASQITISPGGSSGGGGSSSATGKRDVSDGLASKETGYSQDWAAEYNKARDAGDAAGMEHANRQANIERGLGDVVTADKDIEYIKNKYGHSGGGEIYKTGFQWVDGSLQEPERVLSAEQTKAFNKLVDSLPKLDNLVGMGKDYVSNNELLQQIANYRVRSILPDTAGMFGQAGMGAGSKTVTNTYNYHFDELILPNVKDPPSFVRGLKMAFQQEVRKDR